jgi:hypothetical protein
MHSSRHHSHGEGRSPADLRAAAFIDARFLRWLARLDDADGTGGAAPAREGLNDLLQQSLGRADLRCRLLRVYWYAEADDQATCDDQTLRVLPSGDADGAALVRHMAADLQALAASGRIDVALLGSDDDRLAPVVEAAKLAGLTVCLLADERALTMPRLLQQDPNWARLLREADRRVVVRSNDLAQALLQGAGAPRSSAPRDEELEGVVQGWWQGLPSEDQEALRDELPGLRGLPPEVDRELLLRCKNVFNRGLSFPEKRMLREYARRISLGEALATTRDVGSANPVPDDARMPVSE